ncbi:hypothetical protein MKX01_024331 [Papaver californicum]|nr:hypothetical protein MKX01_024331 [Papaver californicum]
MKEGYTQDGTVDLKGRPILRSKGGRWKACSFIVGYELFERLAFFGVLTNLVVYLSTRLHEGTVKSANNVTNWIGTTWMLSILGVYIADTYLGRYWTFVISSAGVCLLFLSVKLPALKPPICGLGILPKIVMTDLREGPKVSWWMFTIYLGQLCANTVIVYIQDNVGWSLGYGLPTIGLAISTLVFLVGTPFYRHKVRSGSPFTHMAMVLVAALRKCKLKPDEYTRSRKRRIDHTTSLRSTGLSSPWRLCPVTRVEETKQIIKMLPILVVTFVPAMVMAQVNTPFIKQGITLERSLGPNFDIPPACLGVFVTLSMLVSVVIYDRYFVPLVRRYTKIQEGKRLQVIRDNGITGKSAIVPLPIFILLPQYVLMGVSASFFLVANLEFFYDQSPESMKSIGTSYYTSSLGIGQFLGSFLLKTVANITERHGTGWILDNVNYLILDYYYAFLGILSFLNLMLFLVFTKWYV